MRPSKPRFLPSFAIVSLAVLALAGCGATATGTDPIVGTQDTDTTVSDDAQTNNSGNGGEVTLSYGDTTYTAQLQHCSLYGGEDALFHGAAYDDSGTEVGYLEGDFGNLTDMPHGEVRVDFGATDKLQSTDKFIAMGTVAGDIVVTDSSETSLIVMGGAWDQDGTQLGTATLRVNC